MRTGLTITFVAALASLAAGAVVMGGDGSSAAWMRACAAGGLAGLAVIAYLAQSRRHHARAEKLSREMDLISQRLVALEARPSLPDVPGAAPSGFEELSDDVGILSRTLASLAETMSGQERELALLRSRIEGDRTRQDPPPRTAEAPPRPVPPALTPITPSLFPSPAARPEPEPPSPEARREAVAAALDAGQVELHLQPVVTLPQRRVRFYEALARLRVSEDSILLPAEFIPTLERLGRVTRLDGLVLTRAVAAARQLALRGAEVAISCNLSPASLKDSAFLEAAERIIADDPQASRRLILEISQRSWRNPALFQEHVARLSAQGVAFALDRATDLVVEPERLARLGVRYAKLPADQLLAEDEGRVARLFADLAANGIQLVAERVEKEEIVPELLEIGSPLAQGFVFGMPRAIRAGFSDLTVQRDLAGLPPDDEPVEIPVASASPERISLKNVLRRAG